MRSARTLLVLLATWLVLLAACSSGDETGQKRPADRAAQGAYADLLAMMPDTRQVRRAITITDVAEARSLLGLQAPASDAGLPERFEEFPKLFHQSDSGVALSPSYRVGVATATADIAAWTTEFGYSFVDVDREINADGAPGTASILQGRFENDQVVDAIRSDPVWSPDLQELTYGDQQSFTWGADGYSDPTRASAARPGGEGGHLVALSAGLAWSLDRATLESVIDAGAGSTPSLADNAAIAGLVDAVTGPGTYEIFVSDQTLPNQTEVLAADLFSDEADADIATPSTTTPVGDTPTLVEPKAIAFTKALGPNGEILASIALANDDTADAQVNAERLRAIFETGQSWYEPVEWATFFDVLAVEVDGTFTVIRLASNDPTLLRVIWSQRDSVFAVAEK